MSVTKFRALTHDLVDPVAADVDANRCDVSRLARTLTLEDWRHPVPPVITSYQNMEHLVTDPVSQKKVAKEAVFMCSIAVIQISYGTQST